MSLQAWSCIPWLTNGLVSQVPEFRIEMSLLFLGSDPFSPNLPMSTEGFMTPRRILSRVIPHWDCLLWAESNCAVGREGKYRRSPEAPFLLSTFVNEGVRNQFVLEGFFALARGSPLLGPRNGIPHRTCLSASKSAGNGNDRAFPAYSSSTGWHMSRDSYQIPETRLGIPEKIPRLSIARQEIRG